jgi:hypothetical protein
MEIYENLCTESLPNEEWRDVVGWEGLYQVSNLGRIKGLPKVTSFGCRTKSLSERILRPTISKRGYYVVSLSHCGKTRTLTIHRIIADAFIPNPENKRAIDHIDTNRLNNNLSNLRWCTDRENSNNPITLEKNRCNCKKMWVNGVFDSRNNTHYRKVAQYTRDGVLIKVWDSIKEASNQLGIDSSSISKVCLGVNPNRKTVGGYIWKHIGGHYIKEKNE